MEPNPFVAPVGLLTRRQSEITVRNELDDLELQCRVRVNEPRQRPIEKALPKARKRPGAGVLERRWPIPLDVSGTNGLI